MDLHSSDVLYLLSPFNTLYLKLQCPAVQPPLVVISNNGCNIINFHQVTVGESFIKKMYSYIKNA